MANPLKPRLAVSLICAAGVLLLLVLRRPETLLRPQFWAEAGPVFYVPTYFHDPLTLLLSPYAGYLHVVPRLIGHLERLVDPSIAPMVGAVASYVVVVAISAFIVSDRLKIALPNRWTRFGLAGLLLATPSAYEILGVEVNLQVYLAAYLVALAIATPSTTAVHRFGDGLGAVLAGLSGPFVLLLAPLFWLRRDWLAVVLSACAAIQLGVILVAPQRPVGIPDLSAIVDVALLRINAAFLGSTLGTWADPIVGVALLIAGLVIARDAPYRKAWLAFAYAALVVAGAGVVSDGAALAQHARDGERFFLLSSLSAGLLVVCGLFATSRLTPIVSGVVGALLLLGILIDLRVPAFPDSDWSTSSRCIGAAAACVVPMQPPAFTFVWPGAEGVYPIPITRPTDP